MSLISDLLNRTIFGKNDFCIFCFKLFDEHSIVFQIDDEITLEDKSIQLHELLDYVFKNNIHENIENLKKICSSCQKTAKKCYYFMKTCEENYEMLSCAVSCITESLENTLDLDNVGSLFLTVDPEDFAFAQYYDEEHTNDKTTAMQKLQKILNIAKSESQMIIEDSSNSDTDDTQNHKKTKQKIYNIPTVPTTDLVYRGTNSTQFQCKTCLTPFRTENVLRNHYFKMHHPKEYICSKCSRRFLTEEYLKEHLSEYHDNNICRHCGKQFKSKYYLAKHEFSHSNLKCQECRQVYRSKASFDNHIRDNTCKPKQRKTIDEATFYCDYCNKKFCNKPYLAKHIKFEHENAEDFKCKFCDKKLYTQSNLAAHMVKHTLEKNHECMFCAKRFGSKIALKYHTRLHTGETPYKCDLCEKSFLSSSRRLEHFRWQHLPPSYECDLCHSKFKTTGSLLKHKKRHLDPNSRLNRVYIS